MLYYIIDDTKSERYNCHTEIRTCRLHMAAAPCCDVEAYIPTYSYERALVSQSVGKSVSWRVSQSVRELVRESQSVSQLVLNLNFNFVMNALYVTLQF